MKTLFCLLISFLLFQQVQAENMDRFQMDFYGYGSGSTIFSDSDDEHEAYFWPYVVVGTQAWVNPKNSFNTFSFGGEGGLAYGDQAEHYLKQAFLQYDYAPFLGFTTSLKVGQFTNLVNESFPRQYESVLVRPLDVELPFTENVSGAATGVNFDSVLGQLPIGFAGYGAYGLRRLTPEQSADTLLADFPHLPQNSKTGSYHFVGYLASTMVHVSWEKDAGHNVSLYTFLGENLSLGGAWTYRFHPKNQIAPDNLYAVKGNWDFWHLGQNNIFSLSSGLDFGEQKEALQGYFGWENVSVPGANIQVQAGYDSRFKQAVAALRFYWRPF